MASKKTAGAKRTPTYRKAARDLGQATKGLERVEAFQEALNDVTSVDVVVRSRRLGTLTMTVPASTVTASVAALLAEREAELETAAAQLASES